MAGNVETSVDDFHVALLKLNRPEARNALSPEMMEEIAAELERLDPDLPVLIDFHIGHRIAAWSVLTPGSAR